MLTYKAIAPTVTGKDGLQHRVDEPLVRRPQSPQGGWKVNLTIKEQVVTVPGTDPKSVFQEAKNLLALNEVAVSDLDLWLNLNLQWIARTPEKYQKVRVSDLMTATEGNPHAEVRKLRGKESIGPSVWGRKGWAMLQQYLANDFYEYGDFLTLATMLLKWVDPVANPSRGCADCHVHFTRAVAELRLKPLYAQEEARRWLWGVMNQVNQRRGIPILSYETASKKNYWS